MIRRCIKCKPHDFQDQTYGKNMRVWNAGAVKKETNGSSKKIRCTVCGAEDTVYSGSKTQ